MTLPFIFERNLYRAATQYKQEHPGVLEERTRQRKETAKRDGKPATDTEGRQDG